MLRNQSERKLGRSRRRTKHEPSRLSGTVKQLMEHSFQSKPLLATCFAPRLTLTVGSPSVPCGWL